MDWIYKFNSNAIQRIYESCLIISFGHFLGNRITFGRFKGLLNSPGEPTLHSLEMNPHCWKDSLSEVKQFRPYFLQTTAMLLVYLFKPSGKILIQFGKDNLHSFVVWKCWRAQVLFAFWHIWQFNKVAESCQFLECQLAKG